MLWLFTKYFFYRFHILKYPIKQILCEYDFHAVKKYWIKGIENFWNILYNTVCVIKNMFAGVAQLVAQLIRNQ